MGKYDDFTQKQLIHRIEELENQLKEKPVQESILEQIKNLYSFAVSPDEIYIVGKDGYLLYANDFTLSACQLSQPYTDCPIWKINPDICEQDWQDIKEKLKSNHVLIFQTCHQVFHQNNIPFEVCIYRLQDTLYDEIYLCFARDISERLNDQRKVNYLNLLMDTILSNIFVAISVKEVFNNFTYIYFNHAAEVFTGVKAKDIIGKTDFELFPDARRAHEVRTEDFSTIKNGSFNRTMVEYEKPDGEIRIVNIVRLLIKNPDEGASPLLLSMVADITDQRQNELNLIKAQEADKMKNAFIANMSHEIRTPLNAIIGFSTLLTETHSITEQQEYLNIINKNSDLLLQLINDILDFSKIESGTLDYHFSKIELKNICKEVYISQSLKMTSDVALLFNESDLPPVPLYTDARRLEQILLNLLSNAIKYTKQGYVMLSYEVEDAFVRVSVTDTGTGIAEDKQHHIFERFIKLDDFHQGTGLGLSICKMLVSKLGGEIGVISKLGCGSTFWFTLPLSQETEIVVGKHHVEVLPSFSTENIFPGQFSILVAEDVLENYLLIQAILKKQYQLLYAQNGKVAVELFQTYHPDLILMDIKMPLMNGFEAACEIRKLSADVPIIALTAFAFEKEKEIAKQCRFTDYLVKPIDIPLLKQKLKYYLSNKKIQ